jgi:hypothetical protein
VLFPVPIYITIGGLFLSLSYLPPFHHQTHRCDIERQIEAKAEAFEKDRERLGNEISEQRSTIISNQEDIK